MTTDLPQLDLLRTELEGLLPLVVLLLDPGAAVSRERNRMRSPAERWDFDDYEGLLGRMRTAFGDDAVRIDSSSMSVDQTGDAVLAAARDAVA